MVQSTEGGRGAEGAWGHVHMTSALRGEGGWPNLDISKEGCVYLDLWISSQCGQGGRGSKNPKKCGHLTYLVPMAASWVTLIPIGYILGTFAMGDKERRTRPPQRKGGGPNDNDVVAAADARKPVTSIQAEMDGRRICTGLA